MATPNLASALDRPASSVEKPKPCPQGSFAFIVSGMPRYDKSTKKQTPFVEFTLKFQSPMDDVDQDELAAWLTKGDGSTKSLQDMTTKVTLYETENSLWRIVQFLEHLGWDIGTPENPGEDADKSLREMIEQSMNRSVGGFMKHETSDDGSTMYSKFDRSFKLD